MSKEGHAAVKISQFSESVIREMSRMAAKYKAVNLAQGLPDFPAPAELKEAACQAIAADINQYSITWGDRLFRQAIAEKASDYLGMKIDPETDITVTCGASEAMMSTIMAILDPGDEVIIFEPFYENYGPACILSGAIPRHVSLNPPDWSFDEKELAGAFNNRTAAIIINTPNNPTGKVFSRQELEVIAGYCQKFGVLAVTDEIYEHILFDGASHVATGSLPGMEQLTVTVNSLSKTYSVTGWRVGYAIACAELQEAIRKVHDFLTIAAPAPLQRAGIVAMQMPTAYYRELASKYAERRKALMDTLDQAGIKYYKPQGAYYIFADISNLGFANDLEFTEHLVKEVGVAVVPGSSFYRAGGAGSAHVRFCFARRPETLQAAHTRLIKLTNNRSCP